LRRTAVDLLRSGASADPTFGKILACTARSLPHFAMPPSLLLLSVLACSVASAIAAEKPAALFNGKDFAGWEYLATTPADIATVCSMKPDGTIAIVGKPNGYIATTASHQNYKLHAEWRWTGQPGNGGVLVHINGGPKDRQWPMSFQVQTKNKAVGDLLPMAGVTFAEPFTTPPGANPSFKARGGSVDSEKPAGEWNTCDIVCRGDTIEVTINGVAQNKVTGCSLREGKIGFQLEGLPFELRNVTLERL